MKRKYERRLFVLSVFAIVLCFAALALAGVEYHQNKKLKAAVVYLSKQAAAAEMAQLEGIFAARNDESNTAGKSLDFLNWKTILQDELRGAAFRLKVSGEALKQGQKNKELAGLLFYTLGLANTAVTDFSAAKENFAQALKYDPRDAESAYNLGLLYSLSKQPAESRLALRYYRLYLELDPKGSRANLVAEKVKQLE